MEQSVTTQQIVTFVDDGPAPISTLVDMVPKNTSAIITGKETRDHTIKDFLRRPFPLGTVDWNSSSDFGTLLATYQFPNALFTQPTIFEKLRGFTYFRASTVVKIQVNATPFMQGRLLAIFVPYAGRARRLNSSLTHLGGITGYPRVDLDLSTSQSMTLKIPFVSPLSHINLVRGFGTIGQVRLYAYGRLAASEAVVAQITTFAWFEDVEVEVPTGLPISAALQSAEGAVASTADLGNSVKLPYERVSHVSSNQDKPMDIHEPNTIQPSLQRAMANGTGFDTSKTFTMASSAGVTPFVGKFGSSKDEMDLSYLTSTPTYVGRFTWNTSHVSEAVIDSFPVHPMISPGAGTPANVYAPTTLGYVSAPFNYWSGSLIFTFKFVKTNFHSGRLKFTFVPGGVFSTVGTADLYKCYSQVVDLRDTSEFEFKIPYVAASPWSFVSDFVPANVRQYQTGVIVVTVINELKAPTVTSTSIYCLKEIRGGPDYSLAAPLYVNAFPFTSPPQAPALPALFKSDSQAPALPSLFKTDSQAPALPPLPESDSGLESSDETDFVALQGFEELHVRDEVQENDFVPTNLFESATLSNNLSRDKICIGEKVDNLAALLKRNIHVNDVNMTPGSGLGIRPYFVGTFPLASGNIAMNYKYQDFYSYYSYLFGFYCGGMRIKLVPLSEESKNWTYSTRLNVNGIVNAPLPSDATFEANTSTVFQYRSYPRTLHFPNKEGAIEFEVPYYRPVAINMSGAYNPVLTDNADPSNTGYSLPILEPLPVHETNNLTFAMYRSVADDFQFGFLVGAPLVAAYENPP